MDSSSDLSKLESRQERGVGELALALSTPARHDCPFPATER